MRQKGSFMSISERHLIFRRIIIVDKIDVTKSLISRVFKLKGTRSSSYFY